MYIAGPQDVGHDIAVWGRFGKGKDRVRIVRIYRRTRSEAIAFVIGLGYDLVGLDK